jgi:hypothetical protein
MASAPRPAPSAPARDVEAERLIASVRASRSAAPEALALASSYRLRHRKRGSALQLCAACAEHEEWAEVAGALAVTLRAEAEIADLQPEQTLAACAQLVDALPRCDPEVGALARAILGGALLQLCIHFPAALDTLDLEPPAALAHALCLAEEAIALAPQRPDGHALLARLILLRGDAEAWHVAQQALLQALGAEAEFAPGHMAWAVGEWMAGDLAAASARVGALIVSGDAMAGAWLLRGLLLRAQGDQAGAQRDFATAARMAPALG